MFENFFGKKTKGLRNNEEGPTTGGSAIKPKAESKPANAPVIRQKSEQEVKQRKNVEGLKIKEGDSHFSMITKDVKSWPEQGRKIQAMSEKEASEYLTIGGFESLFVLITKMRPSDFVVLLEKSSKDALKTAFEDLKKNNVDALLGKVAEKDPTLVNRLIALKNKSGVFNGSSTVTDEGLEFIGKEIEQKVAKEMERKIEDLRAELMEYGYDVKPTRVDGKETLADLGELAKIILEADDFINFRYNRQKGDLEAEKKVGYHDEFKGGGYEIIYDKKGVELADTNEEILAQVRIEARTKMVFNSFRKYLLAKYPERFSTREEEPEESLDKKATS